MKSFLIVLVLLLSVSAGCDQVSKEDLLLNNARTAFLSGKNLSAEELYQNYIKEFPAGAARLEAWERIYDITMNFRKEKGHAISILEAMRIEFRDNQKVYKDIIFRLANLYAETSDFQSAIRFWENYMEIKGLSSFELNNARLQIAKILFRLNQNDDRIYNYLQQCISEKDENKYHLNCVIQTINFYIQSRKYKEAKKCLDANLEQFASDDKLMLQVKLLAAEIYENTGEEMKAKAIYESLKDYHP